jgi:hypothetical protein
MLTSASPDYVPSPPKSVLQHDNLLHDLCPEIFQDTSPFSLATHAFTAVKHKSILHSPPYTKQSFFSKETLSEVYSPELISLVKSVTGAKEVLIITTSVRSKDIIEAEDEAAASGAEYNGRRYAFYSVWRPLKMVTKDPLAVCDPNTIDRERDLGYQPLKRPSLKGDYIAGVASVSGARAQSQKWYWIKEQKEDEVMFLQFFDNYAEKEGRPIGVPHGSPELLNIKGGETRESVETRVIALW